VSATAPSSGEIRDYLLRRMTEAGRTRFEEAYFADDALLDRIEAEEDGLVSDYVLGKLPEAERKLFEESLMGTPYYQERVETTSRLKLQIQSHRSFLRPAKTTGALAGRDVNRTATVVGFSILTLLLVAAVASALRLKSDLGMANAKAAALAAAPATPAPASNAPPLRTVVLDPPATQGPPFARVLRSAGTPLAFTFSRWLVPDGTIRLQVLLLDGNRVAWDSQPLPADVQEQGDVAIRLPADLPAEGVYGVLLRSLGSSGTAGERFLGVLEIRDQR
jgi:hypothetical protein